MSIELDPGPLAELRAVSDALAELRRTVRSVERVRNLVVNRLRVEGFSAQNLADELGVARSRLYQILEEPDRSDPDTDPAAFQWFEHVFSEAWDEAQIDWQADGCVGDPESYFPLERLLRVP